MREGDGSGPAGSSLTHAHHTHPWGLRFLEKRVRPGQGWRWEFLLEKPRAAGAGWGRECYHRDLIFLHTLSAPHLFLD